MKWVIAALLSASSPGLAAAPGPPTPLFASDAPIRLTIQGPIGLISRDAEDSTTPRPATLTLLTPPETHAISLSARGITRRLNETCSFPPLRVELSRPAGPDSLFKGQRRLKLVTHCQSQEGFQQYLLLEFATYRIFNLLSPMSYRVRLATVDYVEPNGKPSTSRWGFFIEDLDDAVRRNGLAEARIGDRIQPSQLDRRQAARVALFEYMIGNLDWSMRAGPQGEGCCHNARLATGPGGALVPFPYDFDYSGLVSAPYAVPPEGFGITSVKSRVYQGYCANNAEAASVAAEFRERRPAIEALFGQIPGMAEKTRSKAVAYLAGFYEQIATDETLRAKILKNCR